jgi:hypothetical protein
MSMTFKLEPVAPYWAIRLKLLALALMLADHIHLVFFARSLEWLYWLSRLVFPIFALIVAQNLEHHEASPQRYISRLMVFGLLAQPFYAWCFDVQQLNVLFTLGVSIALWWLLRTLEMRGLPSSVQFGIAIVLAFGASWLEFGWAGLLAVPIYARLMRRGASWDWLFTLVLSFGLVRFEDTWIMPMLALAIWKLTSRWPWPRAKSRLPTRDWRHAFYLFYPAHLGVLALAQYFI